MEQRRLGAAGFGVSRLCFGTLTMSPLQKNLPPERGAELILYAHERGIDFLDTADLYGTYPHLALALKKVPNLKIASKAYIWDRKTAEEALARAYRGLDREYVDLFMLHEQESIHTLRGHKEALDYLNEQKVKGRIGSVGVSTHFVGCVQAAATFGGIDVIFPIVNKDGVGIQGGSLSEMEAMIGRAHGFGLGVIAMKPLGGGHLIHDNAAAFRYLLDKPWADSIAVGMQSEAEIDANAAIFAGDDSQMKPLSNRERHLLIHDWCLGCGKCVERCQQKALRLENGRSVVDHSKCVLCGYCAKVCPEVCIKVI